MSSKRTVCERCGKNYAKVYVRMEEIIHGYSLIETDEAQPKSGGYLDHEGKEKGPFYWCIRCAERKLLVFGSDDPVKPAKE